MLHGLHRMRSDLPTHWPTWLHVEVFQEERYTMSAVVTAGTVSLLFLKN